MLIKNYIHTYKQTRLPILIRNICKVSDFRLARTVGDSSDVYKIVSRVSTFDV